MDLSRVPNLTPPPAPATPAREDPDVPRAAGWLASGSRGSAAAGPRALVVGAPYAGGSISGAACHLAPAAVRAALGRFTLYSSDLEATLEGLPVLDAGDIICDGDVLKAQEQIEAAIGGLRAQAAVPVALIGGDNSITVGGVRGTGADALLTFDAHHDVRDPSRGPTNGSPIRQLIEDEALDRVFQIGIHGFANGERLVRWATDHGVAWVTAGWVREHGIDRALGRALGRLEGAARIWVDVDLDVLDRAFAPGAPAALPGGLWPADLERAAFLLGRDPRVAGLDLTEVDPAADVAEITVRTAAAILLAFLAGVAER